MLLQTDKSDFILATIKEVGLQKSRNHRKLMKRMKSKIATKIKLGSSRIFNPFGLLSARDSHTEYLQKTNPDSVHMEEFKNRE